MSIRRAALISAQYSLPYYSMMGTQEAEASTLVVTSTGVVYSSAPAVTASIPS